MDNQIKIARVSTVAFFVNTQLAKQIEDIKSAGFDVSVVCSKGELYSQDVSYFPINIERKISPIQDLMSLFSLIRLFRKQRFHIVHSTTPKAGLLCALASFFAGTKLRFHTFTGQTWAHKTGLSRFIFKSIDRLIAKLCTKVYADSPSQVAFLVKEGVVAPNNITFIGEGSLAGVDIKRFTPLEDQSDQNSLNLKAELGIDDSSFVFLFLGRVNKDKGMVELIEAFNRLASKNSNVKLIVVGPVEEDMVSYLETLPSKQKRGIGFLGFSHQPEKFLAISDVMVLPSYREGFGTSVIEAAAMSIPTIGSRIYGLSDAIVDQKTGILVKPKDVKSLFQAMKFACEQRNLMEEMGVNARKRVETKFESSIVSQLIVEEYQKQIKEHKV